VRDLAYAPPRMHVLGTSVNMAEGLRPLVSTNTGGGCVGDRTGDMRTFEKPILPRAWVNGVQQHLAYGRKYAQLGEHAHPV
jgi:hypothetical protein